RGLDGSANVGGPELERMLRWQEGVNLLQQSLLAPTPLADKLKSITDSIVRLFDADFCRIWLIRPGDLCEQDCVHAEVKEGPHLCRYRNKCLHLMASSGRYTHTDGKTHRRVPFGCYRIGRVASGEDHKFVTNDASNDPRVHNHEWARELGLVSFVGYQLRVPGGETMGVLALFAKHPILSTEDAILDGLGSAVALVVQRHVAEEALARQAEELARANARLESANAELVELDRMKSDFVSNVSHELRTPLAAVKAYAETLLDYGHIPEEKRESFLRIIMEQAERLTLIIEDLLDLSRIDADRSKLELRPTDVRRSIEAALEGVTPMAKEKLVSVGMEPLPEQTCVLADEQRLVQILINLLTNAVKFTDSGGTVRARAVPAAASAGGSVPAGAQSAYLCIAVSDNGRGIPREELEHIFDRFMQVADTVRGKPAGTGLGLAICKELVEKMGGKIWAESTLGKGSHFRFTLPLAAVTPGASETPEQCELVEQSGH
ncbi:MAG: GAF domain-containing sensor histidine kinase, partial [Candidatus Eisenbacteria bacterium]